MLIRHIAGVPSATEQRCVRCCEVIDTRSPESADGDYEYDHEDRPAWPGSAVLSNPGIGWSAHEDCKPVDLNERDRDECRGLTPGSTGVENCECAGCEYHRSAQREVGRILADLYRPKEREVQLRGVDRPNIPTEIL